MHFNEQTPMNALVDGLAGIDAQACYEFARRQQLSGHGPDLRRAASVIRDVTYRLQLQRPDELWAWKYPESFEPLASILVRAVLEHGSDNDIDALVEQLRPCSFAEITAISSMASYLTHGCDAVARVGSQPVHPQQSLL